MAGNEVVVVAEREQNSQIDRRVYTVRDNARTQTSTALDVLGSIPTVTVSPNGRVQLLGIPGVRILVDGKEVPDPTTLLRTLQGSQLLKVEVMSNPSGQYSAAGTAGIINVVLRRPVGTVAKATLVASSSSFGGREIRVLPSWSTSRWSLTGSIAAGRTVNRSIFERRRSSLSDPNGGVLDFTEFNMARNVADTLSGNLLATYKPNRREQWSLSVFEVDVDGRNTGASEIRTRTAEVKQRSTSLVKLDGINASLDYRRNLNERGKTLSLSLTTGFSRIAADSSFDFGVGTPFKASLDSSERTVGVRADYANPMARDDRFTLGAAFARTADVIAQNNAGPSPVGAPSARTSRTNGVLLDYAFYATRQFSFRKWKALPSIRVERRTYDIAASGIARSDTNLFPSLHLEHRLGARALLTASYSRRIARPGIQSLDSSLRYTDATTASSGNPRLKAEITNSYEVRLELQPGRQNVVATVFRRGTGRPWTDLTILSSSGTYVTQPVNLGHRTRTGGNLSIDGNLSRALKYSVSLDAALREYTGIGSVPAGDARVDYDGSVQVEYRRGTEGATGSDSVVANVRYNGPSGSPFSTVGAYATADLTWTRTLSRRLVGVIKVGDPIGSATIRTLARSAAVVADQRSRLTGPRFTLSITYRLEKQ